MDPAPARYLIRINGHLGVTVLCAFPALAPHHHGAHTVLTGLLDRSALYGVLSEIEALGLDLLELRKLTHDRVSPGSAHHRSPVTAASVGRTQSLLAEGEAPTTGTPVRPADRPSPRAPERGAAELAASGFVRPPSAGRAEHGGMAGHPERWSSPFTQVEMHRLWTYSDGTLTAKGYRLPHGTARAGSWVLVDQATGNAQGLVPPGEFSRRFTPVDLFADVPGLPTYLGTVTAPDGTALVDLVLDRNPFMLANGPRRAARPHALIVPRSHRDGWSSATPAELAACRTAMTLVAAWYRSMDGGYVVFGANDSAPNLDYLRDLEAVAGTLPGGGTDAAVTKNPRQEVQHAHLHAFYAEHDETQNHESSALAGHPVIAAGHRAFSAALDSDAVKVEPDSTRLAAGVSVAAQPWGGSYCSYQLGVDGPFWVMPALGPSMDEFNRRLARADGLKAEPDPKLGGAINLVRPSLTGARRLHAAQRATTQQRASFETFAAQHALNARSLDVNLAPGTLRAQ
jgi:hypothetical protein